MGQQVIQFSPPSNEGTLTPVKVGPILYKSDSEEDDLVVSRTISDSTSRIIPMTSQVEITMTLGFKGILMALLDSACTRSLVNPQVVEKLGMRLRKLKRPFSQLDGSITGEVAATCLTEPMKLRMGTHTKTIQFIVAPVLTEAMNPS